jgi:CRISPR system Cascade subunit CasB
MKSADDLIYALEQMRDRDEGSDRANFASLRRGMGQPRGAVLEASRVVQRLLDDDTPLSVEETLYVIAPLFAFHRLPYTGEPRDNIGDHFRALFDENEDPPRNVERRFIALLASEPDDLPDALRQAVSLLKSKDVPVNWRRLFRDVQQWLNRSAAGGEQRQAVRLRWSRQFWRLPARKTPSAVQQPLSEPN